MRVLGGRNLGFRSWRAGEAEVVAGGSSISVFSTGIRRLVVVSLRNAVLAVH